MNDSNHADSNEIFQQKIDDLEDDIITLLESHKGLFEIRTLYFLIFRFLYLAMPQDRIDKPSQISLKALKDASRILEIKIKNHER
jgi:hypothetical protein